MEGGTAGGGSGFGDIDTRECRIQIDAIYGKCAATSGAKHRVGTSKRQRAGGGCAGVQAHGKGTSGSHRQVRNNRICIEVHRPAGGEGTQRHGHSVIKYAGGCARNSGSSPEAGGGPHIAGCQRGQGISRARRAGTRAHKAAKRDGSDQPPIPGGGAGFEEC